MPSERTQMQNSRCNDRFYFAELQLFSMNWQIKTLWNTMENRQDKQDIEHTKQKVLPKEESTLILNSRL